jgi:hypothetical protein
MLLKLDTVLTRTLFTLPRQVAPVPQSMEATNEVYFFKKKKKKTNEVYACIHRSRINLGNYIIHIYIYTHTNIRDPLISSWPISYRNQTKQFPDNVQVQQLHHSTTISHYPCSCSTSPYASLQLLEEKLQ